jgi:hypothetical protein
MDIYIYIILFKRKNVLIKKKMKKTNFNIKLGETKQINHFKIFFKKYVPGKEMAKDGGPGYYFDVWFNTLWPTEIFLYKGRFMGTKLYQKIGQYVILLTDFDKETKTVHMEIMPFDQWFNKDKITEFKNVKWYFHSNKEEYKKQITPKFYPRFNESYFLISELKWLSLIIGLEIKHLPISILKINDMIYIIELYKKGIIKKLCFYMN